MEWVLVALVYVVVFVGLFICYGVPWIFNKIMVPLLEVIAIVVPLFWEHVVVPLLWNIPIVVLWLWKNVITQLFWGSVVVLDLLLDHVLPPAIHAVAGVLMAIWREFYYWTVGDVED